MKKKIGDKSWRKSSIYTHSKYEYFKKGKPKTGNSLSLVTVCTGSAATEYIYHPRVLGQER